MQYERVAITIGVVIVIFLAFFGAQGIATYYKSIYGSDVTTNTTMNEAIIELSSSSNELTTMGQEMGSATDLPEGSGPIDSITGLTRGALAIISNIKTLLGLAPKLLGSAITAVGVGAEYAAIAQTIFVVVFALILGYLLLLGVRKL